MSVKFTSINKAARTVTFEVDGAPVTRRVPLVFEGTLDAHIEALAAGLQIEADSGIVDLVTQRPKAPQPEAIIESTKYRAGDDLTALRD